jgi:transposase
MANALKMAKIQSIQQLHAIGYSQRQIARALGIDRGTVARHLRPPRPDPNTAILPAGFEGSNAATFLPLPGPTVELTDGNGRSDVPAPSNAAIPPAGLPIQNVAPNSHRAASLCAAHRPGRQTQCERWRELIVAKLAEHLTAQRIWQDLVADHGFAGSYDSVKRFVRRLQRTTPLPFRRLELAPGEEAQVDFGTGAPINLPDGKRKKTYVFRIVLSHSRKGYSEATHRQTTDDFLGALENAFLHFGGVPKTLIIDNLKAAVKHPDWFDPEIVPKVQAFCRHYGTVILPTRPYMPRHKGKVEAGVKYVQSNALQGRAFPSLLAQNEHLARWEATIADTRIHGTTKRQVGKLFHEHERAALLPLPRERFANFHEAQRKVNRDGHVEVAKAYYSVPLEYLGRDVWVRWDARLVRIFNHRFEQIAVHVRHEQGRFSTHGQHVAQEKINGLERGAAWLLNKVSLIGPHTHDWAQAMLTARGIEGTRVLQGLLALTKKHPSETLERACETALSHACYRLRTIRELVAREARKQMPLPFLSEHPLIRPLDDYAAVVARAIHRQADRPSMGEGFLRHGSGVRGGVQNKNEEGPDRTSDQGLSTFSTRPRSGYSSPGCSSAAPDSASPDDSTVIPPSSFHKEKNDE